MQFLIIAAVAALASANTVARCGDCVDYTPVKIEEQCVVVVDGPNDRKEYTLGLGDCDEAVNFFYDGKSSSKKIVTCSTHRALPIYTDSTGFGSIQI